MPLSGSPTRWCLIPVPVVLVMEICLNPCTGVMSVYFWCLKNSENSSPPQFFSAVVQQCETGSRFERKGKLLANSISYNNLLCLYAYKLEGFNMNFYNLIYCLRLTDFRKLQYFCLLEFGVQFYYLLSPGSVAMEKGKGKAPLEGMAMSEQTKLNLNKIRAASNNSMNNSKALNNSKNSVLLPTLKLPTGGSTSKPKTKKGGCSNPRIDPTAMFRKLAAVRENGKKKKELTLVGFLIGEFKEFPRLFAKLRMEWKPLKGSMIFSTLKSGWFEVAFSNQADFQLIWVNRPYHVFSHLLLLKTWYPGFDPSTESISQLDLWVRLHYLPEEFANSDALETIIEGNCIGKFLKMDPTHNSERWNMFTRFCINTDVEKTMGRGVIVPDEHLNQIKFSLWFDDFSPGCGACGKTAHIFQDCPHKNAPIPTLQITLKKPSSKHTPGGDYSQEPINQEEWNQVGRNNRIIKPQNFSIPNSNVYLSGRGGVNIIYESDESEEGAQYLFENEEAFMEDINLVSVAGKNTKGHSFSFFYGTSPINLSKLYQKVWNYKRRNCGNYNKIKLLASVNPNFIFSKTGFFVLSSTDLHPYNMFMEEKNNVADGIESGISQGNLPKKNDDRNNGISKPVGEKKSDLKLGGYENKITTQRKFQTPITAQLNKGHNTGSAPGMQETSNYHNPGK